MISRVRIKDHWAEQRMFLRRSLAAGVIVLVSMLALITKLVQLQVVRHAYYADLSQGNRVHIEPVPPNRGLILDRRGQLLAENLPAYQLELTSEQVPDIDSSLKGLVGIGLVESDDIPRLKRLVRSRRSFEGVPIRLQLSDDEVARFAVRRHDFPGIDIKTRLTRYYPQGELAVHALGYVAAISEQDVARIDPGEYAGTSLIGKVGIESSYEQELHGQPGYRQVLVNAQGRPVDQQQGASVSDLTSKSAVSGNDLILSLDLHVQQVAEEALQDHRGAVVALDPNNGDVLAFVSKPGFDPNRFGRGLTTAEYNELLNSVDRPLFNRALRGIYPPGSTVKPVIALAGLASNTIGANEHRFCRGVFYLKGSRRQFREGRGGIHGSIDMEDAIARSCDVYFYGLADALGVDRITNFLAPFGFGRLTGIDLPGEKTGLLPSRAWKEKAFSRPPDRVWFPGETVIFGIGQGYLSVTPLQLAHVAAVIAARGRNFKPRLVTGVRVTNTDRIISLAPKPQHDVTATPEHWQTIINGMKRTMTIGTARASASGASYLIAGKTGTAQVFGVAQNEKYDASKIAEALRDHAWFIAFAPADAPRMAVAVLVENGGFGASAAAPIARKVFDAYLQPEHAAQGPQTRSTTRSSEQQPEEPLE